MKKMLIVVAVIAMSVAACGKKTPAAAPAAPAGDMSGSGSGDMAPAGGDAGSGSAAGGM